MKVKSLGLRGLGFRVEGREPNPKERTQIKSTKQKTPFKLQNSMLKRGGSSHLRLGTMVSSLAKNTTHDHG